MSANLTLRVVEDLDGEMFGTQAVTGVAAGGGGITLGNVSALADNETSATLTISHNNNGNYILVDVAQNYTDGGSDFEPTGVTFNGVALTKIVSLSWNTIRKITRWRLVSPASGVHDVVVTWSSIGAMVHITARSFSGVNTSTPEGTSATATGTSATEPTVDVTSATGELVVDVVAAGDGGSGVPTVTADVSQTEDSNGRSTSGSETLNVRGATSHEAGAATVTMSWTRSVNAPWGIIGTPLKP